MKKKCLQISLKLTVTHTHTNCRTNQFTKKLAVTLLIHIFITVSGIKKPEMAPLRGLGQGFSCGCSWDVTWMIHFQNNSVTGLATGSLSSWLHQFHHRLPGCPEDMAAHSPHSEASETEKERKEVSVPLSPSLKTSTLSFLLCSICQK